MSTAESQSPPASTDVTAAVGLNGASEAGKPSNYNNDTIVVQSSTSTPATGPKWPDLAPEHPLRKFQQKLPSILKETGYDEIYGLQLSAMEEIVPFTSTLILQKYLRANANDVEKAANQLKASLQWRKEFRPLFVANDVDFDETKFAGLGYITVTDRDGGGDGTKEIITWNIYGAVKDNKKTFGDVDAFIRWRVALMERAISHLQLSSVTKPIPDYDMNGPTTDPYQIVQVHDYLSVRFLRMDATVRIASQRIIALFQAYYPEFLSRKFFVNVPYIMTWLYGAMKLFAAPTTVRKLAMLSDGQTLAQELGRAIPKTYGGQADELQIIGETVVGGGGGGGRVSSAQKDVEPHDVTPIVEGNGKVVGEENVEVEKQEVDEEQQQQPTIEAAVAHTLPAPPSSSPS